MTVKAIDKLRNSHLTLTHNELMGEDIDLRRMYLALATTHQGFNIIDAVEDVQIQRTIQGASTVTVTVSDRDRILLRSGRLSSRNDIQIDGLYFRLKGVSLSGETLTLTFEDREVALLRNYDKPIKQSLATSRVQITRAQFVQRMVREVREVKIPYFIPQLNRVQPVQGTPIAQGRKSGLQQNTGITKGVYLTVKGGTMTEEMRANANAILDTCVSMVVPRKIMVMTIMCVIQESGLLNLSPALNPGTAFQQDSVGLFQQRRSQGWPATRDIPTDTAAFVNALVKEVNSNPSEAYWEAIANVQRPATEYRQRYANWRTEAEHIVTAYGMVGTSVEEANSSFVVSADSGDYEFYRGRPPNKKHVQWGRESSWDCIQRLAQEVNWRAFFVSGTFYFVTDADLLKSKPIAVLDHDSAGIMSIDGDYDEGKKSATLTLSVEMGRWAAPPGSIIQMQNMGPWNGRWIVNDVSRSAFSNLGSITLKKKAPKLPEPGGSNLPGTGASGGDTWTDTPAGPAIPTSDFGPFNDRVALAKKLLGELGKNWRDDNGQGAEQIRKVAQGQQLRGPAGLVDLDPKVMAIVLWLISQGHKVGTFAWCEDHHDDGQNGHAGGKAVDISSIDGLSINQDTLLTRAAVVAVDTLLSSRTPDDLSPRQLITGGFGNHRDMEISAFSIPSADSYYGATTMQQHTNHIHVGY